jgi:AraC-like DNA-binding protein
LPVELLEEVDGDSVLSALSMLDFAEHAAADSGMHDLGFWAGLMPVEHYGQFGAHVSQAPTLYTALQIYCGTVRTECSEANYYLRQNGSAVWFCHHQGRSSPVLPQHELYALMIMVQVIRLALGSEWKPTRIRLQRRDGIGLTENEWLVSTNVEFGSTETGLEIGVTDLARPLVALTGRDVLLRASTYGTNTVGFPVEQLSALEALIEIQLRDAKPPTLQVTAEMAGTSMRTVQRHLRDRGTSFSVLVDQVRLAKAEPLLGDRDMTITKIALELGYTNVANFSRSFRRLKGMSPKAYRELMLSR